VLTYINHVKEKPPLIGGILVLYPLPPTPYPMLFLWFLNILFVDRSISFKYYITKVI
jgi:hypothetical protein